MPIYEYRCKSCEKVFEVIQQLGDRPLRKCRECSGKLEKLVSRTAFLLKGGGWYNEGYTRSASKKSSDDSKPKESSSGDPKPKSGDSKSKSGDSKSKSATGGSKD